MCGGKEQSDVVETLSFGIHAGAMPTVGLTALQVLSKTGILWCSPKSEVSKSKQCLSEPVAPMPFMQQGIWFVHSASSSSELRSARTSLSLFQQQWVRSSEFAVDPCRTMILE